MKSKWSRSRLMLSYLLLFSTQLSLAQNNDLSDLEKRYLEWVSAWNSLDAEKVGGISAGVYGFGRDAAFMRKGTADPKEYINNIQRYMDSMVKIDYVPYYMHYRIVDGIGLIDGYYAQTTQQENGPLRTVYGRQSIVMSKKKGEWKMVHYHRSKIPDEFVR